MIARLSRRPSAADRAAAQAINDFQSDTAEITGAPDSLVARLTVFILAGMIVLAIALASVIRLDRVVTSSGRIVAQPETIVVQPFETSIIRSIAVRPGEMVRQGQVLATLDPTISTADLTQLERQAASLGAEIARLEAEQRDETFTPVHEDSYHQLQAAIWRYRQEEFRSQIANFDQQIARVEAHMAVAAEDAIHYRRRLQLLSEVEQMRIRLAENEVGSRLNALLASDSRVEVARNVASTEGLIISARHEMAALRAERETYVQQWHANIVRDLVERRFEMDRTLEELSKAQLRQRLGQLRAPEDAVILEIARVSAGSVVPTAERVFTLVPLNATLEVEVDIEGADQGFVSPGDPVEIKLDAYPHTNHGTAKGVVRTISEDSFTQRDNNVPAPRRFFRARIEITELSLRDVPEDFRLVPGMPLTADIVVGSRTIISYLIEGALRNTTEAMREP